MSNANTAELEKQYGSIVVVSCGGQTHAFRCPTLDEFEDHQTKLRKADRHGVCYRELAQITCVTSVDDLKAAFARAPLLATRVHDAILELAEGDIEVTVKKG